MALARVLVVDDDELVRDTLCTILQKRDFEVTCAANVSHALKFISSQKSVRRLNVSPR
jgi:DNA-binding NtrC family response regulator